MLQELWKSHNHLNRECKEEYCKSFFQENQRKKKKSTKVCTGITSILSVTNKSSIQSISLNKDNETITDDEIISNHLNKFFTSVARNLIKKIPNTTKNFDSSLNNEGEKSVFLSPISPEDDEALIATI